MDRPFLFHLKLTASNINQSLAALQEALEIRKKKMGPDHKHTMALIPHIAELHHRVSSSSVSIFDNKDR